jgi:hypothetical protein
MARTISQASLAVLLVALTSGPCLAKKQGGAALRLSNGTRFVKASDEPITDARKATILDKGTFPAWMVPRLQARLPTFYAAWKTRTAADTSLRAYWQPRSANTFSSCSRTNTDHDVDGRPLPPSLCHRSVSMDRCYPQIDEQSPRVVRFFRGLTVSGDVLQRLDPNMNLRRGEPEFAAPDLRACLGVNGIGEFALPDDASKVGVIFEYHIPASFLSMAKWSFVIDPDRMRSSSVRNITPFVSRIGVVRHGADRVEWYAPRTASGD